MFAEGAVVGEYTLQRKLGQGPLAEVWRARKVDRTEPVSLKLLRPGALSPSAMRKAFDRLVAALSETGRLEHPHLPATLGTVRRPSDGLFGLAIPYFDGGPLFDAGDLTNPSAMRDALELVVQLGQTVMWLHDQGVVHGAIKPTNVLASPSLNGPSIRLLDLCWSRAGLCRLEGTRFEPPELKNGPPSAASDQWAIARLIRGLVARRAPEPVGAWAQVPPDLRDAVDRSLSQDPRQRFPRTADLIDALVAAQTGLSAPKANPRSKSLPAPTIAMAKPSSLALIAGPSPALASTDGAAPGSVDASDGEAPTVPEMGEAAQRQIREFAARAQTADFQPNPQDPVRDRKAWDDIDPSADSGVPSNVARRVPRPADPTDPLPPTPPPPRSSPLPFIIVGAAVVAAAVYALTMMDGSPLDTVDRSLSDPPSNTDTPAQAQPSPPTAAEATTSPPQARAPSSPTGSAPPVPPLPLPNAEPSSAPPPPPPRKPALARTAEPRAAVPGPQQPKPPPPKPNPPPSPATSDTPSADAKTVDVEAKDHAWGECRRGLRRACIALATQHERLEYWRAAAKARDEACRQGHRQSCLMAASHYVKAKDGTTARQRYEKLCDNRNGAACAELSVLFRRGIGGRQSGRTADAFLNRACQLGHQPSCR